MTRKIISWLPLWAVFLFTLSSCVHDEVYSASDPESGEYTNKSLWKEDEVYIKNVQQIFSANANLENFRSRHHGLPVWDYAMTFGSFDESYLMVPISGKNGIKEVMIVERKNDKVFFSTSDDTDASHFFRNLIFKNNGVAGIKSQIEENARMMCKTRTYTLCFGNPNGSQSCYPNEVTTCVQQNELGDNEMGNGGDGIDYPSGGGGGNNSNEPPQTPPNPCEKLKTQKNDAAYGLKIDFLKGKTNETFEYGFRVGNTINGSGQPETKYQQLSNAVGTHSIDFKIFPNTFGFMHSHFQGLIPVFSPDDINNFIKMLKNAANNNISLDTIYMTLVNPDGTTYQLWGSNDINVSNLSIFDQHTIDNVLNNKYSIEYDLAKANQPSEFYQKNFLIFMRDKMNVNGAKMYSVDSNGNSSQLSLNGNSLAAPIPCPN